MFLQRRNKKGVMSVMQINYKALESAPLKPYTVADNLKIIKQRERRRKKKSTELIKGGDDMGKKRMKKDLESLLQAHMFMGLLRRNLMLLRKFLSFFILIMKVFVRLIRKNTKHKALC